MAKGSMFTAVGDLSFNMALINNRDATTNPGSTDDNSKGYTTGSLWVNKTAGTSYICVASTVGAAVWNLMEAAGNVANVVNGLAAGYKIARGVHVQVAATDTIVTGLTTVVAVVANFRDAPTVNQFIVTSTIGDQAGSPAAGSFETSTFKPTSTSNPTPIAATNFSDNLGINWIAFGT